MKTKEEAAKEYCKIEVNEGKDNDALFSSRVGMKQIIERAFKSGVEFAEQWISVEDELPEEDQFNDDFSSNVLVKSDYLLTEFTGYFSFKTKQWYSYPSHENIKAVTHWRPINRK